jgi:type IV pilus assembly protein PilB
VMDSSPFLLRALVDDGVVDSTAVKRASEHAASATGDVLASLVQLGLVTARQLAISRAVLCEHPFVDLGSFDVDIRNAGLMPRALAERLSAFPLFVLDGAATVGMLDPLNLQAIDQLRQALRTDVEPVLCDGEQLRSLIARSYSLTRTGVADGAGGADEPVAEDAGAEEPIVAAVNQILSAALGAGASDVHISPDEADLHLRYRVDGVLHVQQGPARSAHPALVQRLKVMAKLDLTQTRRPQDGKFRFPFRGEPIDVRLSLIPTVHGENVVMRLLRPASAIGSIKELQMPGAVAEGFERLIERPHGIILVTGPTGSGKTTTLYTALQRLNTPARNIMTIEDPVEIRLAMVRQVQANPEIGMTFASALRAILRQDPDTILVGEIRDEETAKIAVQASLTGHLVLSTLHTNDAVGAVARLRDFGVPPFAVNSALLCVLAQRLVRRVCEGCAAPDPADPRSAGLSERERAEPGRFVRGRGCPRCMNTGYKGRVGVFEMFRSTPRTQRLIESEAPAAALREAAIAEGMRLMWHDGLDKARLGQTTLDEVSRLRTVELDDEQEPTAARRAA